MKQLTVFLSGLLFAFGLGLSGMVDPAKVIGFLDLTGDWDPSLAFVMGGALLVNIPLFVLTKKGKRPIWGSAFQLPSYHGITGRLVIGAALFGIGWGLTGICPGPALVDLAGGVQGLPLFMVAMVAGMYVITFVDKRRQKARS